MAETPTSVEELITSARAGKLSRRRLIAGLTALGLTSGGAATVAAALTHRATPAAQRAHLKLHDEHVARQVRGDVPSMMADYHDDAVVEDPLFDQPFVGKDAITRRHAAEVASVPDRQLTILHRVMNGDQLIVEWQASGTHAADYLGFGGTGNRFRINGVTVVTRRDGKITRESHYFDAADLRRQVEANLD